MKRREEEEEEEQEKKDSGRTALFLMPMPVIEPWPEPDPDPDPEPELDLLFSGCHPFFMMTLNCDMAAAVLGREKPGGEPSWRRRAFSEGRWQEPGGRGGSDGG